MPIGRDDRPHGRAKARAARRWSAGPGAVAGEAGQCEGESERPTLSMNSSASPLHLLCFLREEVNVTRLPVL